MTEIPIDISEAEPPLVVAFHVGSSAVRAQLFDRLGRSVAGRAVRRVHSLRTDPDGTSEADSDALLELCFQCLDVVLAEALPLPVGALAGCTFGASLLGVDGSGRALGPLSTNADSRARSAAARLRDDLDAPGVHQRTGCVLHSAYWPAQLSYLAGAGPAWLGQTERFCGLGEYLHHRLTGRWVISPCAASWTGLLDRRSLEWDSELSDHLALGPDRLPELEPEEPGRLAAEFRARWPALAEAAIYSPLIDGAGANIGSGCCGSERLAVTVGSSSAVRLVVDGAPELVPEGLWCYRLDARRSLLGGSLSEGGSVFGWARKSLRLPVPMELERVLSSMEPDGHGLTVLPFLSGERAPGWRDDARGWLVGLGLSTTGGQVLRALMEATALRIGLLVDKLSPHLGGDLRVIGSGGALLGSPTWLKILADVLGRSLALSGVAEVSARGAALLALERLEALPDLGLAPALCGSEIMPDPANEEIYRRAARRQAQLYAAMVRNTS